MIRSHQELPSSDRKASKLKAKRRLLKAKSTSFCFQKFSQKEKNMEQPLLSNLNLIKYYTPQIQLMMPAEPNNSNQEPPSLGVEVPLKDPIRHFLLPKFANCDLRLIIEKSFRLRMRELEPEYEVTNYRFNWETQVSRRGTPLRSVVDSLVGLTRCHGGKATKTPLCERTRGVKLMLQKKISKFSRVGEVYEWLEDGDFLTQLELGLPVFSLSNSNGKSAGKLVSYNSYTSLASIDNMYAGLWVDGSEFIPKSFEIDLKETDRKSILSLNLNLKNLSFVKNFFGKNFFDKIQKNNEKRKLKLEIQSKKSEEQKIENTRLKLELDSGEKTIVFNEDFDFKFLLEITKRDLLFLTKEKNFVSFIQKNWIRLSKAHMSTLLGQLKNDFLQLTYTRNQCNFLYFLMKINFTEIEKVYMLYQDYKSKNYVEKENTVSANHEEERFYTGIEEFKSEIERLRMRDQYIREVILENFEKMYKDEIGYTVIQKHLKDEVKIERIKRGRVYLRLDFSKDAISYNDRNGSPRQLNLTEFLGNFDQKDPEFDPFQMKLIPSATPLLSFVIKFVNRNFFLLKNSNMMEKTMTTIIDFTEIKLVSYRRAREEARETVMKRLRREDQRYIQKFRPIIDHLKSNPDSVTSNYRINKSLVIFLTKLNDNFVFHFFFKIYSKLEFMISSKNCNFLVQEILERIDSHERGIKRLELGLSEIEDRELQSFVMAVRDQEKKITRICRKIKDDIRTIFERKFKTMVTQKYAKFVICHLLSPSYHIGALKIQNRDKEFKKFVEKMIKKLFGFIEKEKIRTIFTSETCSLAITMIIAVAPFTEKCKILQKTGKLIMENAKKTINSSNTLKFISTIYMYYKHLKSHQQKLSRKYLKNEGFSSKKRIGNRARRDTQEELKCISWPFLVNKLD